MREPTANAPASMPMPKKAMTQTMGRLGKIRLRPSIRDFFRVWRTKCASTSKIGRAPASLRSNYRPGSKLALRRLPGLGATTAASAAASLRSVRPETYAVEMTRGGKLPKRVSHRAWESGRSRPIPTFPPRQQQHLPLLLTNSLAPRLIAPVDGCRSLRSRSIRQRRFAPMVTGISSELVPGTTSDS